MFAPLFTGLDFRSVLSGIRQTNLGTIRVKANKGPKGRRYPASRLLRDRRGQTTCLSRLGGEGLAVDTFDYRDGPVSPSPMRTGTDSRVLEGAVELTTLVKMPIIGAFSKATNSDRRTATPG